jgi:hypothetical protein
MNYGEILDYYEPDKDILYDMFTDYFKNPIMTKIKNVEKFSMYISKLYCLLSKECRYLIVFVPLDNNSISYKQKLDKLRWDSLQTRTLTDQYEIQSHGYEPIAKGPLTAVIERIKVDKVSSTYSCSKFDIIITLLHTEKNNSDTYQKQGTIIAALETYNTIITFKLEDKTL